jgi:mono/diheme cytochrome c family protein
MPRRVLLAVAAVVAAGSLSACGKESVSVSKSDPTYRGAQLFAQRCQGCHTLDVAGTQGGATKVRDRERTDGPNFNVRKEQVSQVLYAIRNGGFSGAIMPENIVVGQDAQAVAAFVSKYAGSKRAPTISPPSQPVAGAGSAGGAGQGGGSGAPSTGTTSTPAQQGTSSTPEAGTTSTPAAGTTSTPAAGTTSTGAGGTQQASAQGKQIFTQNCGACHTLKDAKTNGQVGPNLDQLKPDQPTVQRQVTNGGGGMPAFKGQLDPNQIKAVSQYVSSVAGK